MFSTGCRMVRTDSVTQAPPAAVVEECHQLQWRSSGCSHTRPSKGLPAINRPRRRRILAYRPGQARPALVSPPVAVGWAICSKADWAGYLPEGRLEACLVAA